MQHSNKSALRYLTISFQVGLSSKLVGWLWIPGKSCSPKKRYPALVMSPGFTALKEHSLSEWAEAFVEAGFVVLVYDHRGFGESQGKSKLLEVNPFLQLRDLQHAITYVLSLSMVDTDRIGLWGTSLSAGHALVAAAIDPRIRCVVAQTPFISGHQAFLARQAADQRSRLERLLQYDRQARLKGKSAYMVSVVAAPGQKTAIRPIFTQSEARDFFTQVPVWKNTVSLQSIGMLIAYEPLFYCSGIGQPPVLMLVCESDTVVDPDEQIRAYQGLSCPKKLHILAGDHFSPYKAQRGQAIRYARDWFVFYLKSGFDN